MRCQSASLEQHFPRLIPIPSDSRQRWHRQLLFCREWTSNGYRQITVISCKFLLFPAFHYAAPPSFNAHNHLNISYPLWILVMATTARDIPTVTLTFLTSTTLNNPNHSASSSSQTVSLLQQSFAFNVPETANSSIQNITFSVLAVVIAIGVVIIGCLQFSHLRRSRRDTSGLE